ncbi:MAG: hypothetical protein ACLT3W_07280 [Bifidobacterium pseudocatenulatum]
MLADAVPGNEMISTSTVSGSAARPLIARFGRVYNTGVTVPSHDRLGRLLVS